MSSNIPTIVKPKPTLFPSFSSDTPPKGGFFRAQEQGEKRESKSNTEDNQNTTIQEDISYIHIPWKPGSERLSRKVHFYKPDISAREQDKKKGEKRAEKRAEKKKEEEAFLHIHHSPEASVSSETFLKTKQHTRALLLNYLHTLPTPPSPVVTVPIPKTDAKQVLRLRTGIAPVLFPYSYRSSRKTTSMHAVLFPAHPTTLPTRSHSSYAIPQAYTKYARHSLCRDTSSSRLSHILPVQKKASSVQRLSPSPVIHTPRTTGVVFTKQKSEQSAVHTPEKKATERGKGKGKSDTISHDSHEVSRDISPVSEKPPQKTALPILSKRKFVSPRGRTQKPAVPHPPVVQKKEKRTQKKKKQSSIFSEISRFTGTTIVIFAISFSVMNASALSEIVTAKIDPVARVEKQIALQNIVREKKRPPTLPTAGIRHENKISVPLLNLQIAPLDNRIVIPKIGRNTPIVGVHTDSLEKGKWKQLEKDIQKSLQSGVVHYPGTAQPGQIGNVFITGHSSYYLWDQGKYKDVFARLHDLEVGDEFTVFWNQNVHHYKIHSRKVVAPEDTDVLAQPRDKKTATLMTCTPIGTAKDRLILVAEEI